MTTTSQDDKTAKTEAGSEPAPKVEANPKEPKTVPLGEHIEQRQKMRELQEKLTQMETRLAQTENKPPEQAAPQTADADLRKSVRAIEERQRMLDLQSELGLASQKQAIAVAKLLADAPSLSPLEALDIAAKRDGELFKDRGQSGFDPSTHGSLRPTPGSQPQPQETYHQKWTKALDSQKTEHGRAGLINNRLGHELAKALNWDHKLIPLE